MTEETAETFAALVTSLSRMPDALTGMLGELPERAVAIRASPDEFSVLENICHLRDIEMEGYATRIRRILNEDNPSLADIDGSRLAIERSYNAQSLSEALQSFTKARQENVALLSQVSEEQLNRTGVLEGAGEVTLGKLMLMMNEHDEGHLDELRLICRVVQASVDA